MPNIMLVKIEPPSVLSGSHRFWNFEVTFEFFNSGVNYFKIPISAQILVLIDVLKTKIKSKTKNNAFDFSTKRVKKLL
jgi:hypothetical protein